MIKLYDGGVYLVGGRDIVESGEELTRRTGRTVTPQEGAQQKRRHGPPQNAL